MAEWKSEDLKAAQEVQLKFEFYFLALVFTILGLSVQTAAFGKSPASDGMEIFGWLLLFISGILGTWRIEWIPVALKMNANRVGLQREASDLKTHFHAGSDLHTTSGEPFDLSEAISSREHAISRVNSRIKEIEKGIHRKYFWHRLLFILGMASVISARAYLPLVAVAKALT